MTVDEGRLDPLDYPGTAVTDSGVLIDGDFRVMDPARVIDVIRRAGVTRFSDRIPVVSVGVNADPGQLHRKLATARVEAPADDARPVVVPVTMLTVKNLAVGVSAHVSAGGYVPATPVYVPGSASRLPVIWLDEDQRARMDTTEPNYQRVALSPDRFPAIGDRSVPAGEAEAGGAPERNLADAPPPGPALQAYVTRHGFLAEPSGAPRRLLGQRDLLADLLSRSDVLRALGGDTPESFVRAMAADSDARDTARKAFGELGWARPTMIR